MSDDFIKRVKDQGGWVIVFLLMCVVFLLAYGFLIIQTEETYTDRAQFNLDISSALFAGSNAGSGTNANSNVDSGPGVMFEVACNQLGRKLNSAQMNNCDPASFVATANAVGLMSLEFSPVDAVSNAFSCKVKYDYNPGLIDSGQIQAQSFCIDVKDCARTGSVPIIAAAPYLMGGSGCVGLKAPATFVLSSISPRQGQVFNGQYAPPPFMHSTAGNSGFALNNTLLESNSLPLMWDSHLGGVYPGHYSASPMVPYFAPFATKETRNSNFTIVPNIDPIITGALSDSAYANSLPPVSSQTYAGGLVLPQSLDPIQYISGLSGSHAGDIFTWGGTGFLGTVPAGPTGPTSRVPYRAGIATQNHLDQVCFGPFKYWFQRAVQQALYMLDSYGIPFGLAAYSNSTIPLMPYVPYHHRYSASWPAPWNSQPRSTLILPLGGPDDGAIGTIPDPTYTLSQFGNLNNVTIPPGAGTTLNKQTSLNLLYQGMSICAREMGHEIRTGTNVNINGFTSGNAPHIFTALPNAYDVNMPVVHSTNSCSNLTNPTMEGNIEVGSSGFTIQRGFNFRGEGTISAGECAFNVGPTQGSTSNRYREVCISQIAAPAGYFPASMVNATIGGEPPNIDPSLARIPYRTCLNDPAQTPNAAVALSTLRLGGVMKSGYPAPQAAMIPVAIANPENRYFTNVTAANVYPNYEPTATQSDFAIGALYQAYNTFRDPNFIPVAQKESIRRMAIIYMDAVPSITMANCLQGRNQCMYFPRNPILSREFPSVTYPAAFPANNAVREFAELAHRMVEEGIEVVLTFIDHPNASNPQKDFLFNALRDPLGKQTTTSGTLNYALCKSYSKSYTCGSPIDGNEPGYDPLYLGNPAACDCVNKPPRKGIHIIPVQQQDGEQYSVFQARMFTATTIALNRILHRYTPIK